ncbi:MAG TPA: DUF4252 domain-containing protein [Bryobacteraceae bacterium]|nr:DUF4252 domain-containing protein [Bryobacteraceae bacterium]
MKVAIMILAVGLAPSWAQEIKLPPSLEKLAEKAEEAVVVSLDSNMLKLLAKFDGGADADLKQTLNGIESIYVRSFQFGFENEYKDADVEALRSQFQGPGWSRIVGVRSKSHFEDGNVDVYFKDGGNGKLGGIVVISAEARELTFVSIVGSISPEHLVDLGGHFHVPKLEMALGSRRKEMR